MSENICKDKCPHYEYCPQVGYQQECQIWWDIQRLAAVRELVRTSIRRNGGHERDMEYAKALESLAAVWPEAVEE